MADWYFRDNKQGKPHPLQKCPACKNLVRTGEEFCPFCAKRLRPEGGIRAVAKKFFSRPDSMTRALIAACVAVFFLQMLADFVLPAQYRNQGGGGFFSLLTANFVTYIRLGSNFHPLVSLHHEYWRWVTYCFLHFGIIHILFNCWAFWDLGRLAERLWGAKQVFATFILSGIVGGWASYAWNVHVLHAPKNSAGASGAICGILGLTLGAYLRNRYHLGEYLGSQLIRWAVYILVFGLVAGADNGAHIGGMASGALLGYFLPPTDRSKTPARDEKIWNGLAAASFVLLVASVAFAVYFFAQGPEFAVTLRR